MISGILGDVAGHKLVLWPHRRRFRVRTLVEARFVELHALKTISNIFMMLTEYFFMIVINNDLTGLFTRSLH